MTQSSDKSILINQQSTLRVVQELFHSVYPYLRITFYVLSANKSEGFKNKQVEQLDKTIGDYSKTNEVAQNLVILPTMSVSDLDDNFQKLFHLSIKISRQSGIMWLPIKQTDGWSLEEQNNEGEALSV